MATSSRSPLKTVDNGRDEEFSMVPDQTTLQFDPSLTERFRNLRDVLAQGIYQRGLKRMAADMEMSPGNLSAALSDNEQRHISTDALERYLDATGDTTPILYLVARYMPEAATDAQSTRAEIRELRAQLQRVVDGIAHLDRRRR